MSVIEGIIFCGPCGNLLPPSTGNPANILTCGACGSQTKDIAPRIVRTETKPSDFPSLLRQKLHSEIQTVERHKIQTRAFADEPCPKCGAEQVQYTTAQLRGADEGTTIFYYCECGHQWSQNN